jgi:hypothetical protein
VPQDALSIAVEPGERRLGVSFRLSPVPIASVEGVVVGPEGPVPAQLLRLRHEGTQDFGIGSDVAATMTSLDGSFTFLNVPPGRYVLEARSARSLLLASPHHQPFPDSPAARMPQPPPPLGESERLWGSTSFTVYDDDIGDLLVDLKPGLTISGSVSFESNAASPDESARESLRIVLETESGGHPGVPPAHVGPAGGFAIPGLLPDRYRLTLAGAPPGWFLASATVAGRDVSLDWLDLTSGVDVDRVTIRLTDRPSAVTGSVVDATGRHLAGGRIIAMPAQRGDGLSPRRLRSVRADVYGFYVLPGLPAGDYDVVAVDDADNVDWHDIDVLNRLARSATRVRLADGGTSPVNLKVVR